MTFSFLLQQLFWLYNGVNVEASQVTGTNPLRLTWGGPLSTNHSGTYTCRAENEVATVSSTFILNVQRKCIHEVHVLQWCISHSCIRMYVGT